MLPVEQTSDANHRLVYQNKERAFSAKRAAAPHSNGRAPDPESDDLVMLVRPRKSRIFYLRKLFDYPLKLDLATLRNLGAVRTAKAGFSYMASALRPIRPEKTLEDFLINRFGRHLYQTFFKSYTEKVWGVPCDQISAEWGAQRIKGLSLRKALVHHFKKLTRSARHGNRPKGHRDLADRKIPLSQAWPWTIVGRSRQPSAVPAAARFSPAGRSAAFTPPEIA